MLEPWDVATLIVLGLSGISTLCIVAVGVAWHIVSRWQR